MDLNLHVYNLLPTCIYGSYNYNLQMGYTCQIWCQRSIDKTGMFMYRIKILYKIHSCVNFLIEII